MTTPRLGEKVGYGFLASKLALDSDLCMFRHFAELNLRNILYLQSELQELELQIQHLDAQANGRIDEPSEWAKPRSYHSASGAQSKMSGQDDPYWDTVLQIRAVLERYNKALRDEAWLQTLRAPPKDLWSTVQYFVRANKSMISEADARYIDVENIDDLVQLKWDDKEAFRVVIEKCFRKFLRKKDKRFEDSTLGFVSDENATQAVRLFVILVSSILPIISIVVLYVIKHAAVRLGAVIIFSVLCSLTLATLTNATNIEILGTTAAYAAVQVVFVSGNIVAD